MKKNLPKTLDIQELFSKSHTLTITSLQIAERMGKNHRHVLRDIKADLAGLSEMILNKGRSKSGQTQNDSQQLQEGIYFDDQGKEQPLLILDLDTALFAVARYDAQTRWNLVQYVRFLEKENLRLLQENITAELTILQANAADSDLERQKLLQDHVDSTNALQRAEQRLEEYAAKISHLETEVEDQSCQLQYSQEWMDKARHHFKKMSRRMAHLEMEANTAQANYDELLYQEYCKRFADWKRPFHKPTSHPKVQGLIKLGWLEPCGTVATPIGRYLVDVRPSDLPGVYGYSLSSIGRAYSGSYARGMSKVLAATLYRIPAHKHANLEELGIVDADFVGLLLQN